MAFESVARTHVGCRRKINEDAILSRPDLGVWAVADGMGGHDAGEVASAMIVKNLTERASDLDFAAATGAARDAIEAANGQLVAMAAGGERPRTIGATVVVLVADGAAFACLWVGDSRAYRARGRALVQISRDHSLVQELVDLGELNPADAASHPNANVVTRAVGAAGAVSIDVVKGEIAPGDIFLLASDGLTRLVSSEELLAGLQSHDLSEAADQLVATCLERGAPDNVSLVIVRAG